ncbi:MAG: hypothetical protein KJ067_03840 [Vicinamibacteria bacterium]|nr:hypothetical protein [Vicinamibacteria bacterium]
MRRPLLHALALLLGAANAVAEGPAQLDRIGPEDGLSQGSVNALARDARGFLWFGTEDGLDRWDGYAFKVYRHRPGEEGGLPSSFVWSLHAGRTCLWVGTNGGGLACHDAEAGTFTTLRHDPRDERSLPSDSVLAVVEEADGTLWAGTERGLARIAPGAGMRVERVPGPAGPAAVRFLFREPAGALWVATDAGLFSLAPGASALSADAFESRTLGPVPVRGLHVSPDHLLAGTFRDGLVWIDRRARRVVRYRAGAGLPSDTVIGLEAAGDGGYWIGTELGAARFHPRDGRFVRLFRSPKAGPAPVGEPDTPVVQPVLSLLVESDGTAWFGTWGDGAVRYDPRRELFVRHVHDPHDPRGLHDGRGRAVVEDRDGALWLGTFGGGLQRRVASAAEPPRYESVAMDGLDSGHRNVWAIATGADGTIWAATDAGLLAVPPGARRAREVPFPARFVRRIAPAPDGDLWVGSDAGLLRYRPGQGVIERFDLASGLPSEKVYAILPEGDTLWLGTWGGLARLRGGRIETWRRDAARPDAFPADLVWALHRDARGRLWAGTASGLVHIEEHGGGLGFRLHDETSGLPDAVVYCVLEDAAGRLWLSSNRGLAAFDPAAGRAVRTFDASDGLPAAEFSFGACHSGRSGLTFGGVRGFVSFDPATVLQRQPRPPTVAFTGLEIHGRPVLPGERGERDEPVIAAPIESGPAVVLSPADTSFTVHFAALDFRAPAKNRYSFRLHGFDPDWSPPSPRRSTTYTNLDPGEYVLQVLAAGADGTWNDDGARLQVRVLPPFWRTTWFRAGVGALGLGLALGWHRLRLRGLERRRRELEDEVRDRTADLSRSNEALRKADALKTEMLGIAAHDLKNPLAIVRGFAELLQLKLADRESREMATRILRSSNTMLGIVTRLLDSAALESGQLAIARERVDLGRVVTSVVDANAPQAARKGQRLEAAAAPDLVVNGDPDRLAEVVDNLVGNAIKYSPEDKTIRVRLAARDGFAVLEVEDEGPGFSVDERARLFRRFSRLSARPTGDESSSGLGLAIVRQLAELHGGRVDATSPGPGRGATFELRLPLA